MRTWNELICISSGGNINLPTLIYAGCVRNPNLTPVKYPNHCLLPYCAAPGIWWCLAHRMRSYWMYSQGRWYSWLDLFRLGPDCTHRLPLVLLSSYTQSTNTNIMKTGTNFAPVELIQKILSEPSEKEAFKPPQRLCGASSRLWPSLDCKSSVLPRMNKVRMSQLTRCRDLINFS